MKTFLTAWVAIIVLGWLLIGVVASIFGSVGLLILAAAVIAALIAVIASQYQDIDDLQKRLEAFRGDVFCEKTPPPTPLQKRGAFRLAPTPPNDSKGRGGSPSPLDTPPRG